MLAGLEPVSRGVRRLGNGVNIGYFAQFQMDSLNPANTMLEELATVAGDLGQGSLRSVLGGFMFSGDDVFKKVAVLSGGEKARLALAKIMLAAPSFLLLDEPTNHLDIPGRQMLEDALSDYAGTLVLISHDRHFINSLCTSMGVIENGKLDVYPGDYDDYQSLWAKDEAAAKQKKSPTPQMESEAATTEPAAKRPKPARNWPPNAAPIKKRWKRPRPAWKP
jgi:ATP-binding cassette subfamily F protein 3